MLWNNECSCGDCNDDECICTCHNLDLLDNKELKSLLVQQDLISANDVYKKNRAELMQIVRISPDPATIIKFGVKLTQQSIKSASKKRSIYSKSSGVRKCARCKV